MRISPASHIPPAASWTFIADSLVRPTTRAAAMEAEAQQLRANGGGGLVSRLMTSIDDDDDGET